MLVPANSAQEKDSVESDDLQWKQFDAINWFINSYFWPWNFLDEAFTLYYVQAVRIQNFRFSEIESKSLSVPEFDQI